MKITIFFLSLVVFSYSSAQQVGSKEMENHLKNIEKSKEKGTTIWDMDTVFISGIPYCIIIEEPNGALKPSDFSVRSIQGKELIYVKYGFYNKPSTPNISSRYGPAVSYYTYYFTDTQNKAEISYGTKVYKTVAKENLIQGDHINSEEEQKFISLNGKKFSEDEVNLSLRPAQGDNSGNYKLVERNRNAAISYKPIGFGIESGNGFGQIIQDNLVIGNLHSTQYVANGMVIKTISVFLSDGTKVAEAKCYGINSHDWNVVTLKDSKTWEVSSTFNNDALGVVQYLINGHYL